MRNHTHTAIPWAACAALLTAFASPRASAQFHNLNAAPPHNEQGRAVGALGRALFDGDFLAPPPPPTPPLATLLAPPPAAAGGAHRATINSLLRPAAPPALLPGIPLAGHDPSIAPPTGPGPVPAPGPGAAILLAALAAARRRR